VAFEDRGATWLRTGDAVRALADFETALTISPRRASALYGRGLAKRARGDAAGGDADVNEAIRLMPDVAASLPLLSIRR
jgi:Flp pilus assembly protein TadD